MTISPPPKTACTLPTSAPSQVGRPRTKEEWTPAASLSSQGWRGHGHTLHATDDSTGLARPLLLARKDNRLGIGSKEHGATSDQWWLNAFDQQLKGPGHVPAGRGGGADGAAGRAQRGRQRARQQVRRRCRPVRVVRERRHAAGNHPGGQPRGRHRVHARGRRARPEKGDKGGAPRKKGGQEVEKGRQGRPKTSPPKPRRRERRADRESRQTSARRPKKKRREERRHNGDAG